MGTSFSNITGKDELVAAVRRAVEANGGKRVSLHRFLDSTGLTHGEVFQHYARWGDLLQAAGFNFLPPNRLVPVDVLMEDWGRVARAVQRAPSKSDYKVRGNFCGLTLDNRFGSWTVVPREFAAWAEGKAEWEDVRELISKPGKGAYAKATGRGRKRRMVKPEKANEPYVANGPDRPNEARAASPGLAQRRYKRRIRGRHIYGRLLDFAALQHAPVN